MLLSSEVADCSPRVVLLFGLLDAVVVAGRALCSCPTDVAHGPLGRTVYSIRGRSCCALAPCQLWGPKGESLLEFCMGKNHQ